jgi:hypothetical protein
MNHYILYDGMLPVGDVDITYKLFFAKEGVYTITNMYSMLTRDCNQYVCKYDSPRLHPDGFSYIGWGVLGGAELLVR